MKRPNSLKLRPGFVLSAGLLLCLSVALSGCGPVEYVNQVTRRASASVAAAKAAGADKVTKARYDYTLSVLFLRQARMEAGHAHFQTAVAYGRLAERSANDARAKALGESEDAEGPAGDAPPEGLPAMGEEEMPEPASESETP